MTKEEFVHFRELPGKTITADITFIDRCKTGIEVEFRKVVINIPGHPDIVAYLDGSHHKGIGKTKYNISVQDLGPVCRIDVNGQNHGDVGRTHKHALTAPTDPDDNLPMAVARPDLNGLTPREIFDRLCQQANITMQGIFNDP